MNFDPCISPDEDVIVLENTELSNYLLIYNDDVNTFDWVIQTLIEICKHTLIQAEQCAWIIHYNGKCKVKTGSFNILEPLKFEICDRGIDARIEA